MPEQKLGPMDARMNYSILTFGCRVNQADSMDIERELRHRGGRAVASSQADLVVVNSCSVTATADQGTRQAIRRVARENPSARIVVTGCYATRCPDELAVLPGVATIVPNDRKDWLVSDVMTTAERYAGADGPCGAPFLLDRTALTIRVQTGCEERCSYCIIPTTRGTSRSKPIAQIVDELTRAEASGFLDVTLTGVHIGAYGRDLDPPVTLAALLSTVVERTRHLLIRLGSLEPMDAPASLVTLASTSRLAPAFHLPLQHASDTVLARMRRPYTLASYRRTVDRIRDHLPHAAIGSDIIVGFPGESHAEFDALCRYLESSPLTTLHVFPYSDRPGTEASRMAGKIDGPVTRERGRIVREIGQTLAARFKRSQLGRVRPALTIEDGCSVVTDNGLRLRLASPRTRNERVSVRIGENDTAE
jgi:threonylcarbamoyladenosine tRNA methylthiotransferase MtaB